MKSFVAGSILAWTLFIVGFTGAVIFSELEIVSNDLGYIAYVVAWITITLLVLYCYARKRAKKIYNVLAQECNPKDYISYNEVSLTKRNTSRMRNRILINICVGYLADGNVEEGKRILDTFQEFPSTKSGAACAIWHSASLAEYYLMVNDLDSAKNALDSMKEALKNPKLEKKYKWYYNNLIYKSFIHNMAKGNYGGAEEYFNNIFEMEDTLFGKVGIKCHLGELYMHLNDSDKAAEAFEYVAKNGNQTYYTKKAHEYLKSINREI